MDHSRVDPGAVDAFIVGHGSGVNISLHTNIYICTSHAQFSNHLSSGATLTPESDSLSCEYHVRNPILQLPKVFDSEVDHFPNCKSRPAEVEALLKYVSVGCNINTRTLAQQELSEPGPSMNYVLFRRASSLNIFVAN